MDFSDVDSPHGLSAIAELLVLFSCVTQTCIMNSNQPDEHLQTSYVEASAKDPSDPVDY